MAKPVLGAAERHRRPVVQVDHGRQVGEPGGDPVGLRLGEAETAAEGGPPG